MAQPHLVYCTFPNAAEAEQVAETLVLSRLAACITVSQPVVSIYRWQGKLCKESEVQATIKTAAASVDALCAKLVELHSYDCPEVVVVPIVGGNPAYLRWVKDQHAS